MNIAYSASWLPVKSKTNNNTNSTKSIADKKGKWKVQILTGDIWIMKVAGKYVVNFVFVLDQKLRISNILYQFINYENYQIY